MSGSTLGTLLVQRLDAVLGTSIASHPHLISGLRGAAVTQPGATARMQGPEDATRAPPAPGMLGETETHLDNRTRPQAGGPAGHLAKASDTAETYAAPASRGTHATAPAGAPNTSAAMLLGPTAKLIQALFTSPSPSPAFIKGTQPLVAPGQTPDAPTFLRNVQHAISSSGVFYESHLNSMTFGKLPKAALAGEPQAKWTDMIAAQRDTAAHAGATARGDQTPQPATDLARSPEASSMLRHQLETLASQQILWRGEAWPDAPMDLEIMRDPRESGASDDAPGQWQSTLTVTLPNLGEVRAHVRIVDDQVSLRIESAAHGELRTQALDLKGRLAQQGLTATSLDIVGLK